MPSITRRATDPGRRASVEAQILAATERLLAGGASFTELGVQRIAAEAGVARSTFYTHFRDKSELLVRLAHTMRTIGYDTGTIWKPSDGLDVLIDVFQRIVRVYREYAAVLAAINEVAAYDATVRDFWIAGHSRFIEHTAQVLTAERDSNRIPDLHVSYAAQVIVIGGDRAITEYVATTPGDSSGDDAFGEELAKIWWYGAYQRRP
ncbi:TetR family transcriptional regulator [Micromonospora pisi]|uniref:TetR family transcriptional regulator n=1 Tax=Micromonospora pisi TaxID=589240 RepID=A0A495JLX7_9ACTN|nr:TetR/AcrR family transcriptional regulator [Micromonospora pisi]RKR89665.1 TetR family transcriptional regulator [Micromonospora pisi]